MSERPPSGTGTTADDSFQAWASHGQPADPVASILLVDDRPANLLALEAALAPLGHRIVTAASGEAALRCISSEDFAVVLLDVHMPIMDGFETAALIKEQKRSRHTPIIFLTAQDDSNDVVANAYRNGGVDFLTKPLNLDAVRSKVTVFVDLFVLSGRVERQRYFLQALLESLQTAIVACDADGNVTTYNGAVREFFGLPKRPVPPERWSEHYCLYEADGTTALAPSAAPLARALAGEHIQAIAMVIAPHTGRARTVLVTGQPITDAAGGKLGAVVSMHDITARRAAEQAAAESFTELLRSNKELEQFAYVASHDLQEPLRMVSSYTQLLARRYKGKLDADADEFIAFAVDGVVRMQRLINDLLAYARIGSDGGEITPVDSGAALDKAIANLSAVIRDNNAAISRTVMPVVPADPAQLAQLFQNLLSNALKFRREEPPKIAISAELTDARWHFTVRDSGIGIEPTYFDRIFVIFQRLHTRDKYAGTGIGLSICKKIVERHRGAIWLESEVGAGSTFHFALPAGDQR